MMLDELRAAQLPIHRITARCGHFAYVDGALVALLAFAFTDARALYVEEPPQQAPGRPDGARRR
jgi:hypothetical protein